MRRCQVLCFHKSKRRARRGGDTVSYGSIPIRHSALDQRLSHGPAKTSGAISTQLVRVFPYDDCDR